MSKRRHANAPRQTRRPAPKVSRPLGFLLSAASAHAAAAGSAHNVDPVAGYTTVTTTGTNVQQVVNSHTSGGVAINVFNHFVVGDGNTVNLIVPNGSTELVNIVRSSQPEVWGVLNSYQNNQLGGNVVFASSYGFLVGSSGVVNVGKMTLRTPSQSDIDSFVDGSKAIGDLASGTYSISSSGLVQIDGKVNTQSGLVVDADRFVVGSTGAVIAGNAKAATYVNNESAVNTGDLTAPKTLKQSGGTISIVAKGSSGTAVDISGDLLADGGITVEAPTIALNSGSVLDTRNGTSGVVAGDVTLTASAQTKLGYGQASSTTSITLAGEVQAVSLSANATSVSSSSYSEDWGAWAGMTTIGAVAGLSGNDVMADATSTVLVKGTAKLQSSGNMNLGSVARATASDPAITLNGNALVGAAVVYGSTTATSSTQVSSGASVTAGGKLSVTSHNENELDVSALTVVANNTTSAVVSVAVGDATSNSTAKIETGASVTAGSLALQADNHNSFYVSSTAYGLTSQSLGAAVALGTFTSNTTADLGASLGTANAKIGDVSVLSLDRTDQQEVHSSATVGPSIFWRTVGAGALAGLSAAQNAINGLTSKLLPGSVLSDVAKTAEDTIDFRVGAAFSLAQGTHNTVAHVGNNVAGQSAPTLQSSGNVVIGAVTDVNEMRTSTESAVAARTSQGSGSSNDPEVTNSGSIAINLTIESGSAIADVGDDTTISASHIGVSALQFQPIVNSYDRWETFSDWTSRMNGTLGAGSNLFTSFADATGEAEENSIAFSLNYQGITHDTKAWVSDRANLTSTGAAGAWSAAASVAGAGADFSSQAYNFAFESTIAVHAYNQAQSLDIAGNAGALLFIVGTGAGDDGKSLGASVSDVGYTDNTVAGIGKAATVNAGAGDLKVDTQSDDSHIVAAPTSGVGSGLAFNGIVGVLSMDNTTAASINNTASVTASAVTVDAAEHAGSWAAAGSFAYTDSKAVGIAVAINDATGDTRATIGDNSVDDAIVAFAQVATSAGVSTPTAGVTTDSLTVHAISDGTTGAISAAGAATSPKTGEPGYGQQFENKWNSLLSSATGWFKSASSGSGDSSVGGASKSGQQSSGAGDSEPSDPGFGFAASGTVAVTSDDLDTTAGVTGATINKRSSKSAIDVQALSKVVEVSAAGSAAFVQAGKEPSSSTTAVSGAVAVLGSKDDAQAYLSGVTASEAGIVNVQAAQGGQRLGIGLGFSVNTNSADGRNFSVGASASVAQVDDSTSARIEGGSSLTASGALQTVTVQAYDRTDIGIGGGSLYAGGKGGVGLAVTYAEIDDGTRDVVEAKLDASTLTNFYTVDLSARDASRIASGAAGLGGGSDTSTFAGSFAINNIGGHHTASVSGSTITGAGTLNVNLLDGIDSSLDSTIDGLGSGSEAGDYDFSGSLVMDGTQPSYGARALAVAGFLQAGKNNLGIAYTDNMVHRTGTAQIQGSTVNASNVTVDAQDKSWLVSVSAGLGASTGSLSGVGSVSVNEVNNQLAARIGDWDGVATSGVLQASNVDVEATNRAEMYAASGAFAFSKGSSGGLAVALNLVGTDEHSTKAQIGWTDIDLTAGGTLTVAANSGSSSNDNSLTAIGIGVALSQQGLAFAGSIGVNNVDQTVDAGIKAVGMVSGGTTYRADTVNVSAADHTTSEAYGFMGAGADNGVAAAIGVSTNRLHSNVTAELLGGGRGATFNAGNLVLDASRDDTLVTVDAGIAAAGFGLAGAGSVGTNITSGTVTAQIADSAKVDAENNVTVSAQSSTFSAVGGGAVGLGLGSGAAVGALVVSTAIDSGTTQALIDSSTVTARGDAGTATVRTGELASGPAMPDLSDGGNSVDRDALSQSFEDQALAEGTQHVSGIVVNATSYEKLRVIDVSGAGTAGAGAGAINVATNDFEGATKAKITGSTINATTNGAGGDNVTVRASDHSMGLAISAGLAGAMAGGGVAGLSMNLQSHDVDGRVESSTTTAQSLVVDAKATQMAQAVAAGGAAGGTGAGAASVVVTTQYGDVRGWIAGGTTTASSISVTADRQQESDVAAGAASVSGEVGVGLGLAVSRIGGATYATIGRDPDDDNATTSTTVKASSVTVDAARAVTIDSYTFGVGIGVGAAGVAGMVNVSDETGETRAGLYDATLRNTDGSSAAASLAVNAEEIYSATHMVGVEGSGFTGIGAAFNVVLSASSTVAELVGSDVKATTTGVNAEADRQANVYSVAGGTGAFAGAVSLGFIKFGEGDSGGVDSQFSSSASAAETTTNAGYASKNSQLTAAEQSQLDASAGGLSLESQVQNSAADASATVTGDGQTLKLSGASLLAARVSGGKLDTNALTVSTDGRTHAYTLAGAVQGSLAGLSGGLGITREYLVDSAVVDTQLSANGVAITARERDGSGGASGEVEAFSAGAGGFVVGVAYSDVLSQNRVAAGLEQGSGNKTGNLSISASDATSVKVGGDNEDSPENVSVAVGVIGASVSRATKNSDVDAWVGDTGLTVQGYNSATVDASVSGQVRATGFAVSAGVIGVQGVSSSAKDESSATAKVAGTFDTSTSGTLAVTATVVPETYARAYGVTVAAGAAVGGSFAYATVATSAEADIADNTKFAGSGAVTISASTGPTTSAAQNGYVSADAYALAAAGGLLAGVAATEASATNTASTTAKVGNYVTLPTGDLDVEAFNYSFQRADGDAYFGGAILGIGSNSTSAISGTSTQVLFGVDPSVGASRAGDLTLVADSTDRDEAYAVGGGGGVISGSAADATVKATDSSNAPAAAVIFSDWTKNGSLLRTLGTGGLKIRAAHDTEFFTGADTTAVSVVGGAAADASTTVDLDAKVILGKNIGVDAQAIDMSTSDTVGELRTPSLAGWSTSVNAGAGGGINGYAAQSTINISNQGSSIALGDYDDLDVWGLSAHDTLGNRLRLDAYSTLSVIDTAQLSTGGAIQSAVAGSSITSVQNNSITLGTGATLNNEVDKVELGTYSYDNVWSVANAKTYAAVGAAGGSAIVDTTVNNNVTLGASSTVTGYGSVSIYAGRSADSITDDTVMLNAVSDVYNWTAAPIDTSVTANATANVYGNIDIGAGANISSVRNIWLQSVSGRTSASGTGRGHNPYLELLSQESDSGSGHTTTSSAVTFEGTATIEAGTRHDQSVTIAADGTVTKGAGTEATVGDMPAFSSKASLQTYIDELTADKATVDTYVATLSAADQASYTYSASYQQIVSQLSFLTPLLSELSSNTVDAVYVGGITAAGGDVHLAADKVTVKSGAPTITAHGDPTITVTNDSSKALVIDTLTIPDDSGGQVLVTGGAANSLPAALKLTQSTSSGGSQITITHNPGVDGADLFIQGDVTNLGGTVTVDVERGSLLQTANVSAKQMDISVSDIYLVNVSGMQSYGFSPLSLSNYVTSANGWKPASPDEAVMWWISSHYKDKISSSGNIGTFNSYFYGTDYASNYSSGDIVNSNIFFNWGFNDSQECSSNCTTFTFPNHAGGDTRGNGNWKFDSIVDDTGKLTLNTSYSAIKNSGFFGTSISSDALNASLIAVNAGTIDINGTIRAGNFNNWSVDVGSQFDSAIAQYVAAKGLKAGDTVSITPGQPLTYSQNVQTCVLFFCGTTTQQVSLNSGVSLLSSGDAGISLTYDVATGKLSLDDVQANGNGTVLLRGKIVSTGQDGKILVDDGLGSIRVHDESNTPITVNDLNAGSTSTGLIRITDTNYSGRSDWYVHAPGELIKHYVTSDTAQTYTGASYTSDGYYSGGQATTTYQPKTGQWYTWTESAEVKRSYTAPPDYWFAQYSPVGDWKWSNQDNPWTVSGGSIVTSCSTCGSNYLTGVFSAGTLTYDHTFSNYWEQYTYSNYYGSTFTDRKWTYVIPDDAKMSVKYYVKADNPITMQFIGSSSGTVEVSSTPTVTLAGTISNSSGSTSITSTQGSIVAGIDGVINSQSLTLSAAGSIGSATTPLSAITSQINAKATGGSINLDLAAQNSAILLDQIAASGDVTVVADKTLTPNGSGTHLQGNNVSITSTYGSLGDVSAKQQVNVAVAGQLTVSARGDVNVRQKSGNLTLNTIASEAGDVSVTVDSGQLLNGIDTGGISADEAAYLAGVWSSLNLTGANAGQDTVKAFENQVSSKYQQYYLIKQRLADDSDANFTISAAYLEAMRTRVAAQQGVDAASLTDAQVTAAVRSEYEGIQGFFSAQFGAAQPFDAAAAYNSSWRYTVDPSSALYTSLTTGAQWKQSQLDISISTAALQPITTGYLSSRAANISGNNVTLSVGSGSVGQDAANATVTIDLGNPSISDADKALLVTAGPGDLTMTTTATQLIATVKQQDPLKINATGQLKVNALNEVYVESDDGLTLGGLTSTSGDIRLTAGGNIQSGTGGGVTISAAGLNIATTQGSIGAAAAPVNVQLSDALHVASAPGDIYITSPNGGLALGSIGAGGFLGVTATGALTNWDQNGDSYHIVANGASFDASQGDTRFDIGSDARAIGIRLTGGTLALNGDSAHVDVTNSASWVLGKVDLTGALDVSASGSFQLSGPFTAGNVTLHSDGAISAASGVELSAHGALTVTAASLSLANAAFVGGDSVVLDAEGGALSLGNAGSGAAMSLLATGGLDLYGELIAQGGLLADAQAITMHDGSRASVVGDSALTAIGDVRLTAFGGSGALTVQAGGLQVDGAVSADHAAMTAGAVVFGSQGSLATTGAAAVDAASIDMAAGSSISAGSDLSLITSGDQNLAQVNAGNTLQLKADSLSATVLGAGSDAALAVGGNAQLGALWVGGHLDLQAQQAAAFDGDVWVGGSADLVLADAAFGGQFVVAGGALDLQAAGAVTQGSVSSIWASGDLNANAISWTMAPGSQLASAGTLALVTAGDQSLAYLSAQSLQLQARDLLLSDQVNVAGGAVIQARNLTLQAGMNVGGALQIDAAGDVAQAAGSAVAADSVAAQSAAWTMASGSSLAASNGVSLVTGGDQSLAQLVDGGALHLAAGGNLQVIGHVQAGDATISAVGAFSLNDGQGLDVGTVALDAAAISMGSGSFLNVGSAAGLHSTGSVKLAGLYVGGPLTVWSDGSLELAEAATVLGAADLHGDVQLQIDAPLAVGGTLKLGTSGALMQHADVYAGSSLTAQAGQGMDLSGTLSAGGAMQLHAGGAVVQEASSIVTSHGDLVADAAGWQMDTGSRIDASKTLALTSTGDETLRQLHSAGAMTLKAGGSLELDGPLQAGGNTVLKAGQSMTLAAAQTVNVTGALTANAASLDMGAGSQIKTSGDATLKTQGDANLAKLAIGKNLGLDVGGNAMLAGTTTIGGTASVSATGGVQVNANVTGQSDVTLHAGGDVTLADHVTFTARGNLSTDAADWLMGDSTLLVGGNLVLDAAQDVALANVWSTGDASVTAGRALALRAGGAIHTGGALAVDAASLAMAGGSSLSIGGDAQIRVGGDAEMAQTNVGGSLAIDAGHGVVLDAAASVGNALSLNAGGSLSVNAALTTGGDANLVVANDISLASAGQITVGGMWSSRSATLNLGAGSLLQVAGGANLQTDGDATLAGVNVGGDLALAAGGRVAFNESFNVAGQAALQANAFDFNGSLSTGDVLAINAAGTVTQAAGSAIQVGTDFVATAGTWQMGAGSLLGAGRSLSVVTTGDQALAQLVSWGSLALNAGGNVTLGEQVQSSTDASIRAAGVLRLADAQQVNAGGNFVGDAASLAMGQGSAITSGADASIATSGDAAVARLAVAHDLSLNAGGSVALNDTVNVGGAAQIQSASDLFANGDLTTGGALAFTAAGNVNQASGQAIHAGLTLAGTAQSWNMQAGSTLAADQGLSVSTAGSQTLAQVVSGTGLALDAGGDVSLNERVRAGGDAAINAGGTLLLADGQLVSADGNFASQSASFRMGSGSALVAGADAHVAVRGDAQLSLLMAAGNVVVAAEASLTLNDAVGAGGAAQITSGAGIAVNGNLEAAGTMSLSASDAVHQAAGTAVHAGGALTASAAAWDMGAGSSLASDDALSLATSGDQTLAQLRSGAGLTLNLGGQLALNEQVQAGGDASVKVDGTLTLADAQQVSAGGSFTSDSASLDMGQGSGISSGADIRIKTGGAALAHLGAGGDLAVDAGNALALNGSVDVGGSAQIKSGAGMAINGDVTVSNALALDAAGAITLAGAQRLRAGGALHASAASFSMGAGSSVVTGGDAQFDVTGQDRFAQLAIGRDLRVDAKGDVAFTQASQVVRDATVTSGGRIAIDAPLSVGGHLALVSAHDTSVRAEVKLGDGEIRSGANLLLMFDVAAGGDLRLVAAGDATQAKGQATTAGGTLDASASDWTMSAGSRLQGEGALSLSASGDVLLASVVAHGPTLAINAGGSIDGLAGEKLHLQTGDQTQATLNAGLGLGDPLVADVPWLSVTTRAGDINLIVERGLYSPLLSAASGNVNLTVHGSLTFDHLVGNPWLWVDGAIQGGSMTMQQGSLSAKQALDIDQVELVGGGPLSVSAPDIALTINSDDAPVTHLTLTGFAGTRADNVDVTVQHTGSLQIDKLSTRVGTLHTPANLSLDDASASDSLQIVTPAATLSLDNVNAAARVADAQLITPQNDFWLQLKGTSLFTDALVTRFQSPIALYFHRADEQQIFAQQAFYRLSSENLAQEIGWSSWRMVQTAPRNIWWASTLLSLPQDRDGAGSAVNLTAPVDAAGTPDDEHHARDRQDGDDVVVSLAPLN